MNSIEKQLQFTCPKCKEEHKVTCFEQIGPDQKEQVMNSSIFQWDCESCGHKVKLVYPTMYCNEEKKFVIFLRPNAADATCIGEEEQARFPGFTKRFCKTADTFVEKVRVLEAGLNDQAIELLKLITFAKIHVENDTMEDIFFYRMSESGSLEFTLMYKEDVDGIDIDFSMYENVLHIVQDEVPPLEDDVYCIDLNWAGAQVV
ncbi:CpXC domain-containing protein [Anaerosporobacter faecicola]|uniref:CpXC domain-containing protein n=1 Tax=Anaerosporobacter faecicola TaxID=2718714 RepID=UPI00143BE504|nr:CpXC domain-containing protein [Anaerosporobacter faecicola]